MHKALLLLGCTLGAFTYETERNVLKLGQDDFETALQQHPNMLVKFFAPWCGHCKNLAPTYLDAADALSQLGSPARLAEVDCTVHQNLCQKYGIRGYPTVNFFSPQLPEPLKYTGQRTKQAIVQFINQKVPLPERKQAAEVQAKEQEVEEVPITHEQKQQEENVEASKYQTDGKLLKLNAETFQTARNEFDYVFVKFYAPWCGHCKNMGPAWLELANSNTNQNLAIAEVDCTVNTPVCQANQVRGYPTLKLFVRGNEPISYAGARNKETFTSWLEKQMQSVIPGAEGQKQPEQNVEQL